MNLVSLTITVVALSATLVAGYDTECYPDIGCFTNAPPWGDTPARPIDTMPDPPSEVNTQFFLDTRGQGNLEIYYSNMAAIAASTFDSTKPIRLIIHGYVDGGDTEWMMDMSNTFLAKEDQNIIRVTWIGASLNINYDESAVNAEIAGATAGLLVNNMISSLGVSPAQFHCIGHSIGAHVCAYVGNNVLGLGRISGLDPAGTYFEGTDAAVRLDQSDAEFVDVIHTDADTKKGYGTPQQSGDVDFWPNGGVAQPGCDQNIVVGIVGTVIPGDFVECNHIRAVDLFTESILTSCPFRSYPCQTYGDFVNGNCVTCESTGCPQEGYYADVYKDTVQLTQTYLQTNGDSPYCEYMTYVSVTIGDNTKKIDGSLFIKLVGDKATTETQQLGGDRQEYELTPGGSYKALTYFDTDPGEITSVVVEWKQKEIELGRQHITVQEVSVFKGYTQTQYTFCGDLSVEMKEKEEYTLNSAC